MVFVKKIKQNGITYALYNSSTPEEASLLWKNFSFDNQELFNTIKSWAKKRLFYFDTHKCFPLFEGEKITDYLMEIGLIIYIIGNEAYLCDKDINSNEAFLMDLVNLLWKSSNPLIKSAGDYIYCYDFESLTAENLDDFKSDY